MSDASKFVEPPAALEKRSFDDETSSAPDSPRSPIERAHGTAKVWAKMDLYVLPVVTILYFLSSLVRFYLSPPALTLLPYMTLRVIVCRRTPN